jgi:hypothetical protein
VTQYPIYSLDLSDLRLDGGTQTRAALLEDTIEDYATRLKEDPEFNFPPGMAFDDSKQYWVADGFHRHAAYYRAGRKTMPMEVRPGSQREALQYALSANVSHGLRRSSADKLRALEIALADPEWREWSNYELADLCGVSEAFVRSHRPDFDSSLRSKRSDTVKTASQDLPPEPPTPEQPVAEEQPAAPKKRKYKSKSGKTATMRTERIGRKKKASAGSPAPNEAPVPVSDEPAAESVNGEEDASPDKDALGLPLPAAQRDAFAVRNTFQELRSLVRRLQRLAHDLARTTGGCHLAGQLSHRVVGGKEKYVSLHLRDFADLLKGSEPYASVCPWCHREHPGRFDRDCKACSGLGWVPRHLWERASKVDQERVEALKEATQERLS